MDVQRREQLAWQKLVPLGGLAVVLGFALLWDQNVIAAIQREAAATFHDRLRLQWVGPLGQLAAAAFVLVTGWLLFRWAPSSRLVGLVFALLAGYVLLVMPVGFSTHWEMPFWREITTDLFVPYSVLSLSAPFLALFGLIRVAWPLPGRVDRA